MPESKHRRKNKARPRAHETAPPPKNPPPSPTWIPATGLTLLVVGVLIIIAGYFPIVQRFTAGMPLGGNITTVTGFVLLTAGLGFLTRWR
ncbi:MAG: cell division protein CrgA [Actinomycetes bacterium]